MKKFLTDENEGLSARFEKLLTQLTDQEDSLVASRLKAIQDKTAVNEDRIERMNAMLDRQEEALYLKFYNMELAISKIQSNLSAINSISLITMPSSSSSS